MTSELHFLSLAEVARRFASRRLSPVEYLEALFAWTDKVDPALNVYVAIDRKRALSSARDAHKRYVSGTPVSPIDGIPVSIKDMIDVEGFRTTNNSRITLNVPAAVEDAFVVALLRKAGAVLTGKVQTLEFATGGVPGLDLPFPPSRNPWNPDYYTGGSSSGSGAGVASGMFPVSIASDGGGSIRNPAGACGIVGLKPTYGLISKRGAWPYDAVFDFSCIGPLARTVEDVAMTMDVVGKYDALYAGSRRGKPVSSYTSELEAGVRGIKIGFVRHFHEKDVVAHDEVKAAIDAAVEQFIKLGATVRDVAIFNLEDIQTAGRVIGARHGWRRHADWLRTQPENYGKATRRSSVVGSFVTDEDYERADRIRIEVVRRVDDAFREVDILLTANSIDLTPLLTDEAALLRVLPRQARLPFNLTGHPAIALMSGLCSSGMPLSIQLVAPHWEEVRLLRAAAAYERSTPWRDTHPRVPTAE